MFLSLLEKRRSMRRYLAKPVEPEKIAIITEAALRAPSSRNLNPWEYLIIDDPDLLKKLSRAKTHGSGFLAEAPLAVVVSANAERCDVWIEDAAIAALIIQLTAESLGLGSCWAQIRKRQHSATKTAGEYVREVLAIPDALEVLAIIGIGYPAEVLPPHSKEELDYQKVFWNHYGQQLVK